MRWYKTDELSAHSSLWWTCQSFWRIWARENAFTMQKFLFTFLSLFISKFTSGTFLTQHGVLYPVLFDFIQTEVGVSISYPSKELTRPWLELRRPSHHHRHHRHPCPSMEQQWQQSSSSWCRWLARSWSQLEDRAPWWGIWHPQRSRNSMTIPSYRFDWGSL